MLVQKLGMLEERMENARARLLGFKRKLLGVTKGLIGSDKKWNVSVWMQAVFMVSLRDVCVVSIGIGGASIIIKYILDCFVSCFHQIILLQCLWCSFIM